MKRTLRVKVWYTTFLTYGYKMVKAKAKRMKEGSNFTISRDSHEVVESCESKVLKGKMEGIQEEEVATRYPNNIMPMTLLEED